MLKNEGSTSRLFICCGVQLDWDSNYSQDQMIYAPARMSNQE